MSELINEFLTVEMVLASAPFVPQLAQPGEHTPLTTEHCC